MDFENELRKTTKELTDKVARYLNNLQKVDKHDLETRYKKAWDKLKEDIRFLAKDYILCKCDLAVDGKDEDEFRGLADVVYDHMDIIKEAVTDFLVYPDMAKLDEAFEKLKKIYERQKSNIIGG